MKKTTKILLVLAAVVAMTIGAVSTVMAADEYPVIGEWIEVKDTGWQAKDTAGEEIVRGWATKDGFWYFFDSSYMLTNTFVTWNTEIYYLDGEGHMATGWIGFDSDAKDTKYDTEVKTVDKYVKDSYAKIIDIDGFDGAFEIVQDDADTPQDIFVNPLNKDYKDKVLWCYFDESGVMAQNEWVEAWGIHYYIAGAYCIIGDYSVALDGNKDGDFKDSEDGVYGFGYDGAMLVGWVPVDYEAAAKKNGYDIDTPYFSGAADKKIGTNYTYYNKNGIQVNRIKDADVVEEGWEKIDGKWCYFIEDDTLGMRLLQNNMLTDTNTDEKGLLGDGTNKGSGIFYLDADGYMVTGSQSFAKKYKVNTWDESAATSAVVEYSENVTFLFDENTGNMLDGIQGNNYYNQITANPNTDKVFIVTTGAITTTGIITVAQTTVTTDIAKYEGQRVVGKNFFVVIDEADCGVDYNSDKDKDDTFIYYFESGKMQKNQAITFGETTIGIDANGLVVGYDIEDATKVKVAGIEYKYTTKDANLLDTTLTLTTTSGTYVINGIHK